MCANSAFTPDTSCLPSGWYATDKTSWSTPLNVNKLFPVTTSNSLTVRSLLAETSQSPFGPVRSSGEIGAVG